MPIPLPLLAKLKAHRQAQGAIGLQRIDQDSLVFVTATGRPQSRRNALRAVNVASRHVGLWSDEDGREPVGLHDLRHSAASFYFDAGWKTREVSRLLRHANPTVTLTVYARSGPGGGGGDPGERPYRLRRLASDQTLTNEGLG